MRLKIFKVFVIFLMLFSIGLVLSAESTINSIFAVGGCTTPSGEGIGIDSCSIDGNYYCNTNGVAENTRIVEGACSGSTMCCPSGYECNLNGGPNGGAICEQRVNDCSGYNEDDCENNNCFWIEPGNPNQSFCADRPSDYSCSVYSNPTECETDFLNLGRIGFGAEICGQDFLDEDGKVFVAPAKNCGCVWQGVVCKLHYDVTPDVYAFGSTDFDRFSCRKEFSSGFCKDSKQNVTWGAEIINVQGFSSGPFGGGSSGGPDATLVENSQCYGGDMDRTCGEKIVRLPGFGNFALISSTVLIGLFYFLRRDDFEGQ